jgi:hypothetical protein
VIQGKEERRRKRAEQRRDDEMRLSMMGQGSDKHMNESKGELEDEEVEVTSGYAESGGGSVAGMEEAVGSKNGRVSMKGTMGMGMRRVDS